MSFMHTRVCAFICSEEQVQLDFMEILRVRDEKRRMRHVEVLRKQKDLEDEEAAQSSRGERGGEAWIELMGDQGDVFSPLDATFKPHPPIKPASRKPPSSTNSNTNTSHRQVRHCYSLPVITCDRNISLAS